MRTCYVLGIVLGLECIALINQNVILDFIGPHYISFSLQLKSYIMAFK